MRFRIIVVEPIQPIPYHDNQIDPTHYSISSDNIPQKNPWKH